MIFLAFLSSLFGWTYTLAWSGSFYAQPLLNYRRRSTSGSTVDFPFINVLGFAAYLASSTALYLSPLVRSQYAARNKGLEPTVQANDLIFALHALVLSVITASHYLLRETWGFAPAAGTKPSRFILAITGGCLLALAFIYVLTLTRDPNMLPDVDDVAGSSGWCELDLVYAAGYVKLVITLVKYSPQVLANARNRSTVGWSIWQVLLDVVGGVLSMAQQAIDSYLLRDWSGITGNPVKFALGNASLVYDSIFMTQHYILYPSSRNGVEQDPLLLGEHGEGLLRDDEESVRRQRRLD
ncbi:hypothetical protein CP533_2211 [Ophiocordyceps camponoti-saundersi (nom. inval.)]|nr:hypothetical protein CP533_2211 [Ophiocordyceps camponoti-saundersi (nom. inval.)]